MIVIFVVWDCMLSIFGVWRSIRVIIDGSENKNSLKCLDIF